jgi:hypothetical protein
VRGGRRHACGARPAPLPPLVRPSGRDRAAARPAARLRPPRPRRRRRRRRRRAPPGEWRTNVSLGGSLEPAVAPPAACRLALRAAAVVGGDFVGVDLLPTSDGPVVLELNGAVDFKPLYALPGTDVYAAIADALALVRSRTLGAV